MFRLTLFISIIFVHLFKFLGFCSIIPTKHSLKFFYIIFWLPTSSGIPPFWLVIFGINTILMACIVSVNYCYVHAVFCWNKEILTLTLTLNKKVLRLVRKLRDEGIALFEIGR